MSECFTKTESHHCVQHGGARLKITLSRTPLQLQHKHGAREEVDRSAAANANAVCAALNRTDGRRRRRHKNSRRCASEQGGGARTRACAVSCLGQLCFLSIGFNSLVAATTMLPLKYFFHQLSVLHKDCKRDRISYDPCNVISTDVPMKLYQISIHYLAAGLQ